MIHARRCVGWSGLVGHRDDTSVGVTQPSFDTNTDMTRCVALATTVLEQVHRVTVGPVGHPEVAEGATDLDFQTVYRDVTIRLLETGDRSDVNLIGAQISLGSVCEGLFEFRSDGRGDELLSESEKRNNPKGSSLMTQVESDRDTGGNPLSKRMHTEVRVV